jgi:epimerase transport system membrane fusion protein
MNVIDQPAANDPAAEPAADPSPPWQEEMRRALRAGICGTVLGVVALSAWAALAPLAAAVIAEGTVKSAGNRKTVQHAEGGIVAAIHVKDGDRVKQGQPLITLDDARVAAGAQSLREQWIVNTLKVQRLGAETRGVAFTPDLRALEQRNDPASGNATDEHAQVALLVQREQELFSARARQQAEQARWLSEQLSQIQSETKTQHELIATTESALRLAQQDLAMNEKLKADGFISAARLAELQRIVADYRARVQAGQSQLSQARQKEADIRLKLSAQRTEFARAAADELKEITAQLAQTAQALRPALDAQTRQQLVAPVDGEVVGLKVHTVGAAIGPREPVLDIVPTNSELVIEARIVPSDIRDAQKAMAHGALAHVMLPAYRTRSTPQVDGRVTYVGADRQVDPQAPNAPYYVAHVNVSADALEAASRLAGQPLVLSPGMQAEVFIPTAARSAWRYLFDPVLDGIRHSLRER